MQLTQSEARRRIAGAFEKQSFSVRELIEAHVLQDAGTLARYRENSDMLYARDGLQPAALNAYRMPDDKLRRDFSKATGGALVGVDTDFASALFGASLLGRLPLRRMEGLVADVSLAATSSTAVAWQAGEDAEIVTAQPAFGARALTPKTAGAVVWMSHQFRTQATPAAAAFSEQQLARALAQALDVALIDGSGGLGEPQGMLRISGTTAVSGVSLAWAGVRDMLAAAEGYDSGSLAFVAGVTTAKILRAREKATGSGMVLTRGEIDGVPCYVSRACPTDALILAPWQSIVYASWGGLQVVVSPIASGAGFAAGKIGVRMMVSVDYAAEQPACIAKSVSIT